MTKDNYSYISDIFWPYIYGQFGVFGFIAYTLMMFMLIKFSFKNIDINDDATYSIVLIWIYAIVASMAEAFFTNSSVAQFAIIIPLLIKYSIDEKKRN